MDTNAQCPCCQQHTIIEHNRKRQNKLLRILDFQLFAFAVSVSCQPACNLYSNHFLNVCLSVTHFPSLALNTVGLFVPRALLSRLMESSPGMVREICLPCACSHSHYLSCIQLISINSEVFPHTRRPWPRGNDVGFVRCYVTVLRMGGKKSWISQIMTFLPIRCWLSSGCILYDRNRSRSY